MKKITPEQMVAQINHGLATDIRTAQYIVEQEKRVEGYKQTLEDMQSVFEVLNQAPFKGMFYSLIQSAIDERIRQEEVTEAVRKVEKTKEAG